MSATAQTAPPVLRVDEAPAPKIDGVLDDACWQGCAKLSGFIVTAHGVNASQQTEVMICRDKSTLYVAFVCHDSSPGLIHAAQNQRNSSIGSDDYVTVYLDSLHTHLLHYSFEVNALGTQYEEIPNGASDNITWRGDWRAAAKITDTGWNAEIAIPFGILRYPSGANTIGVAFARYLSRADESSYWPDLGPNNDLARYADLTDLKLPSQRGRPVFMPYTVASKAPDDSFTQIGFDYKNELPNNIITMMTYNPDFADIQNAVSSIDYSYTERRTAEPRPFFYEGCQMFIDDEAYCSRRVGDIDWGLKTFGKVGPHSFTFLDGLKQGQMNHFTSSYGYDFDRDSYFSVSMNGSSLSDAYKTSPTDPSESLCFSSGGYKRWRSPSGTTSFNIRQFSALNSNGCPDGNMIKTSFGKSEAPGHLGYSVYYEDIDPTFYVRDGYVPLIGVRGVQTTLRYHDNPASGKLTYWDILSHHKRYWASSGGLHHESMDIGASLNTRTEWRLAMFFSSGSWLGASDQTRQLQVAWLSRHLYGGGSAGYTLGKRAGQDYLYYWCDQSLKLTPKVILSAQYERTKLGGVVDSQYTLLTNYQLSSERSVGAWVVGRDAGTNLCCTFRQAVRSGSDIYLIYGYPNTDHTVDRFAIKIVTPMAW